MARGALVPLSRREETALRLISNGMAIVDGTRTREIERLKQVGLVEQGDTGFVLTALGRQRLDDSRTMA
jgi:Mn-dependent DtxR family transcriptional regulator